MTAPTVPPEPEPLPPDASLLAVPVLAPDVTAAAGTVDAGAVPSDIRVRGTAPARTPQRLAALLRRVGAAAGLSTAALDQMAATTATWLQGERRSSPRTQAGYIRDLSWWLSWVDARAADPTDVDHVEADLYAAALRAAGLAPATRARRLSAVSSWYGYLQRAGLAARNPFGAGMERPRVSSSSTTRGLSADELERLLAYARARESTRTFALLALMVATGCRVGSVTATTIGSLGHDSGHRTIDLPVKGGRTKRFVLPPLAAEALDDYLAERRSAARVGDRSGGAAAGELPAHAPLFATRTGRRIDQPYVFRLVRRVAAAAGIDGADHLSPHSLRHAVATMLLDKHDLHIVQDFMGHASPATTRRYDQDRDSLDRSPAYDLSRLLKAGMNRHRARYTRHRGDDRDRLQDATTRSDGGSASSPAARAGVALAASPAPSRTHSSPST